MSVGVSEQGAVGRVLEKVVEADTEVGETFYQGWWV